MEQFPFAFVVLFQLMVITASVGTVAAVIGILVPIPDPPDRPDRDNSSGEDPVQPEPTGGDHIDWTKFHEDFEKYSKEVEHETVGSGIS